MDLRSEVFLSAVCRAWSWDAIVSAVLRDDDFRSRAMYVLASTTDEVPLRRSSDKFAHACFLEEWWIPESTEKLQKSSSISVRDVLLSNNTCFSYHQTKYTHWYDLTWSYSTKHGHNNYQPLSVHCWLSPKMPLVAVSVPILRYSGVLLVHTRTGWRSDDSWHPILCVFVDIPCAPLPPFS